MDFNPHDNLVGRHAFLSASKYHWIRYDDEKMLNHFQMAMSAQRGTELHAFAHEAIRLRIKLPKTQQTLNMYVNDALGFHMTPEQVLCYSSNAFGTADAIWFGRNPTNTARHLLRIHDLKNGVTKSNVNQLEIYAALFCLEYQYEPHDIDIELRIYQNDERQIYEPDPDEIKQIMMKLIHFDNLINMARQEVM